MIFRVFTHLKRSIQLSRLYSTVRVSTLLHQPLISKTYQCRNNRPVVSKKRIAESQPRHKPQNDKHKGRTEKPNYCAVVDPHAAFRQIDIGRGRPKGREDGRVSHHISNRGVRMAMRRMDMGSDLNQAMTAVILSLSGAGPFRHLIRS